MTVRTLSDQIAERVIQLRKEMGLTREDFVERCRRVGGDDFSLGAMANIETGRRTKDGARRRKVDVDELAVFAAVLKVPLVWLMIDARSSEPTPLYGDVEADPWSALAWLSGLNPLDETSDGPPSLAYRAIYRLNILVRLLEQYRMLRRMLDIPIVPMPASGDQVVAESGPMLIAGDADEMRRQAEEAAARTLRQIADQLGQFRALQLSIPELPSDIRKHAAELGIELPSQ